MTFTKEQIGFVCQVSNYDANKVLFAKFAELDSNIQIIKDKLTQIPVLFGENSLEAIKNIDSTWNPAQDKVEVAAYHLLKSAIEVTEATSAGDLHEALRYQDSYFDDFWQAIKNAGIEWTHKDETALEKANWY